MSDRFKRAIDKGCNRPSALWRSFSPWESFVVAPRFPLTRTVAWASSPYLQGRERRTFMSSKKARTFVGIDVSKNILEVGVHEHENHFRCANKPSDFPELIAELIALQPALIVLEAK